MENKPDAVISHHSSGHGSLFAYISGYVLSIALTLLAYLLVKPHVLGRYDLIIAVASLAMVQLVVQLVFFLHLSQESRPRWRLQAFLFMIMVVAIVVVGSVWIMHNLNYHMTPQEVKAYMQQNEGL
jgi:cytochrome o ubiquinol oxidase operon protein cyoD